MINFQFKKLSFEDFPKSDPSFYKRFHMAWINFQENELEAKLQTMAGGAKKRKPRIREAF